MKIIIHDDIAFFLRNIMELIPRENIAMEEQTLPQALTMSRKIKKLLKEKNDVFEKVMDKATELLQKMENEHKVNIAALKEEKDDDKEVKKELKKEQERLGQEYHKKIMSELKKKFELILEVGYPSRQGFFKYTDEKNKKTLTIDMDKEHGKNQILFLQHQFEKSFAKMPISNDLLSHIGDVFYRE